MTADERARQTLEILEQLERDRVENPERYGKILKLIAKAVAKSR